MGCDIYFYKVAPEAKSNDEGCNLLYIKRNYEGVVPIPVGVEYLDFDKYFEGKDYHIDYMLGGEFGIICEGKQVILREDDVPTFTNMENTVPVEQIGYYRISYGGSFKDLAAEKFSVGFSKEDDNLINVIETCIGDETDMSPEFFKNNLLVAFDNKGFEKISSDLRDLLDKLPETQIIFIAY